MKYLLYPLQFDTPVHFGTAENGGRLEQSDILYRADTLFGALCCELALEHDEAEIDHLYELSKKDAILFSDLFPYSTDGRDFSFYLPKPILSIPRKQNDIQDYEAFRRTATLQKKQKKLKYLKASDFPAFLQSLQTGKVSEWPSVSFCEDALMVRVNKSEEIPRPYYVSQVTFSAQAGLYGILAYEKEADADWILNLLESLGLTGIGGKRSSGYGKFHLLTPFKQNKKASASKDADALFKDLAAEKAKHFMALSTFLPVKKELHFLKEGQYSLCKRSGFLSPEGLSARKKCDVYMVQSGSCFHRKLKGRIADVASDGSSHPVWRYGKSIYLGLMI
ncbi:type III-A CRISPR-associated RAMP protein Csm4 [uncultured Megasphaera sp.]|uniref:type III-A CRISPR-associated RAMP protein Csm4 n=1 Tax=uncultured Megasphaera sp. TaxID=165188 RepID=UPI0025CCE9A8|nr:type III-A CRISPR-associated RAMP protein Csm4 [uncultured Megasphaera sp.]